MKKQVVYGIFNFKENGVYVGITINYKNRKGQHEGFIKKEMIENQIFLNSIKKYSLQDFEVKKLGEFNSRMKALAWEKTFINLFKQSTDYLSYNKKDDNSDIGNLTIILSIELFNKFCKYARKNKLSNGKLMRKVLNYYFQLDNKTPPYTYEDLESEEVMPESMYVTKALVKRVREYSNQNCVHKNCIYKFAVESFLKNH